MLKVISSHTHAHPHSSCKKLERPECFLKTATEEKERDLKERERGKGWMFGHRDDKLYLCQLFADGAARYIHRFFPETALEVRSDLDHTGREGKRERE